MNRSNSDRIAENKLIAILWFILKVDKRIISNILHNGNTLDSAIENAIVQRAFVIIRGLSSSHLRQGESATQCSPFFIRPEI